MNTVGNANDTTNEHTEKLVTKWWSGEDFKTNGA